MQFWWALELVEAYGVSGVDLEEEKEFQLDVNLVEKRQQQQLPSPLQVDWEEALLKGFLEGPSETPDLPVKKWEQLLV